MQETRGWTRAAALACALLAAALGAADGKAQTFDIRTYFHGGDVASDAALIEGTDGKLYGTTLGGGSNGQGAVFRIEPNGSGFTILHSFVETDGAFPYARLLQADDGHLYGTTTAGGGPADGGTIFRLATDGSAFTTLHVFGAVGDGAHPYGGLVQATDGLLYGTTSDGGNNSFGIVFKIDTAGVTLTKLHDFNGTLGSHPMAGLIQASDFLYGTTSLGAGGGFGMIFRIDTAGLAYTPMHAFLGPVDAEGSRPLGDLVDGGDGYLYGTTERCGAPGCSFDVTGSGTIFRIATFDAAFESLHSFSYTDGANPQAGLVRASDGNFYGTTLVGGEANGAGTIFRIDSAGSAFETLEVFGLSGGVYADGASPRAGLLQGSDGKLYGTTTLGGNGRNGTVFRIDATGSDLTTLHDFVHDAGSNPNLGVVQGADGFLYGTTISGGSKGHGTVFRVDAAGGAAATLHSFAEDEGRPSSGVIQGADGRLYGTTAISGPTNSSTIYRIDTNGAEHTIVHVFEVAAGFPTSLIQGNDGYLYGTTAGGGAGFGTIFKIDTAGITLTPLHDFDQADNPSGLGASSLIQAADGKLYGTTPRGGNTDCGLAGCGTIFRLDTDGTGFETIHVFVDSEGGWPDFGLLQGADDSLYGGLTLGPLGFSGSIFKIDTAGASLTTLHLFAPGDGDARALTQGADGELYGTTVTGGGGNCPLGCGTIFRLDTDGANFTPLHDFVKSEGQYPSALIQAADGVLYGTAAYGGVRTPAGIGNGAGVVFAWSPCALAQPPTVAAPHCIAPLAPGQVATVSGGAADTYVWNVFGGEITSGQGTSSITFTSGGAGTRVAVTVFETDANGCVGSVAEYAQVDFDDVAPADPFHPYVCSIGEAGITSGCGGGSYCPGDAVKRDQMAVFLLKAKHGSSYAPPSCAGTFADIDCPGVFTDWVEQLAAEGITVGCGGGNYCPGSPVTRAQMAVFLLKAEHGSAYTPPACGSDFADVPCPSLFADWIEQLAAEDVTAGCGGGNYCPGSPNTRGQMAVFIVRTFGLSPYAP